MAEPTEMTALENFYYQLTTASTARDVANCLELAESLPKADALAAYRFLGKYITSPRYPVNLRLHAFDKGVAKDDVPEEVDKFFRQYVTDVSKKKRREPYLLVPYTIGMYYRMSVPQNWLMR